MSDGLLNLLSLKENNYIYADYNATSPISKNVQKHIIDTLYKCILNPSSLHKKGQEARRILENTRDKVRNVLGVSSTQEIIFTSGATEANNMVMKGITDHHQVISAIEHPSILESADHPHIVPVNHEGVIDLLALEKTLIKLTGKKIIVSVMMANNETGVIQPIGDIVQISHRFQALCHTDATQSVGKIKVDMEELGVDLLTFSSHKFGGILGTGVLIFNKNIAIKPIIIGGQQERGIRGGTENVIAITGLSTALDDIPELLSRMHTIKILRDHLETQVLSYDSKIKIFSKNSKRLPNTSFIYMPGVKNDIQMMYFDLNNIAVSNGSACSSGKIEASQVLLAMGITHTEAECAIRISIGPDTSMQDIKKIESCWYNLYHKRHVYI
ncbi:cysteine desulfurase family protein [Wolbachia endosymbiont of Howardula sp.]|uniref:cysteine desulfurase family protein n=1 Tax=Wolbachia endosymbiont of Howardula sp. TaxID=2916816 RepID=UPI00217E5ABF|nr:cysteine desulfurase family protein [Wolbachia endosymbiont of Howardula sp.]UWI83304.1 cysteine desulfurase [Wolbachia endosymbiont of Howardula sp.]